MYIRGVHVPFTSLAKDITPVKPPSGEQAWSEMSFMYSSSDFSKYNPDALMGRKGSTIYRKMMTDEQVKAAVKFKRDAITSRDFSFELDAEQYGLTQEQADERIALSYEIVDNMKGSWMDTLNNIMSATYNGLSMNEKIFNQFMFHKKTWWGIERIKIRPFNTFRFKVDEYGNTQKLTQKIGDQTNVLDIEKFIHFVVNPDVDEHYGQSELREVYRAWFSKDNIIKFRNIWLEKHAGGFRWVNSKSRPGTADYVNLQSVMSNIYSSTGVILPEGMELHGDYPANNDGFKKAIDDYNTDIARGLLVPNLLGVSPEGQTGSYAQSTNQLESFLWTLEADTARLEDALNEQLFKQLGDINFGDGAWPRYKFQPVSKSKMLEIVTTWKDLVTAGAVTPSKKDEEYMRELLEMPASSDDDDDDKSATRPDTALNGAQVSSMVEVISKVADGTIPKESAIQILVSAFPLSMQEAQNMVNTVEVREPASVPPQLPQPGQPSNPDQDPSKQPQQPTGTTPQGGNEPNNKNNNTDKEVGNHQVDETVIGQSLVTVSAFSKAVQRVDFAVIDKASTNLIEDSVDSIAGVMDLVVKDLIEKGRSGGELSKDVEKNIEALSVDSKLKGKLNKTISTSLKDSHALGLKHAQVEVDRAKKDDFSRKFNRKRLDMIAEDFFKVQSFRMAGNLTDDAVKTIENIIMNGARYDWTWDQVEKEVYREFAAKGMISAAQAREALGEALGVDNPDARLRTVVRTSTFDAINTARYDYFTDPGLSDFVRAFQYSAILDSRTTAICRHLDDDNAGDHSAEWYADNLQYRPPNHYNCRSLLVPVTEVDIDSFEEGPEPEQQPQAGFGGR